MRTKSTLSIIVGALAWLVMFSLLQRFCVVSIPWHIEKLWTEQISKGFVKNMIGAVAFYAIPADYTCDYRFIYIAKYYPNGVGSDYERVSLTDIVDLDSWKEVERDAVSTTYIDKSHKFILYNNSDGVYMGVFDR